MDSNLSRISQWTGVNLREQILQELEETIKKEEAEIKKYRDKISNSGKNDLKVYNLQDKKKAVEEACKWKREMLSKYR